MLRFAFVCVVLTACSDPEFTGVGVYYEEVSDDLYIGLGTVDETPCPTIAPGDITLNGDPGFVTMSGGDDSDPDSAWYGCLEAEVRFVPPALGDGFDVEVRSADLRATLHADLPTRVWTDDDLAAAYTNATPFTISWTPPEVPKPFIGVAVGADQLDVDVQTVAEGSATYLFVGTIADPTLIRLSGTVNLELAPITCSIPSCSMYGEVPFDVEAP